MAVVAFKRDGGVLTILATATESEEVDLAALNVKGVWGITFYAPATLPESVKFSVAAATGGTYGTLQSPAGTDIVIAAGKAVQLSELTARALKLVAGAAVAANRVFTYTANLRA